MLWAVIIPQDESFDQWLSSTLNTDENYKTNARDESILLFFLPIFLSSNSLFPSYYAQNFAWSSNILLKAQL